MADTSKRPATFTPEQLQGYIDEALKRQTEAFTLLLAETQTKPAKAAKGAKASKAERMAALELKVITAFRKKGFQDAVPRVNVKTFNLWMADGRRVIEGQKSLAIGGLKLFHVSQTRPMNSAEVKEAKATKAAKEAAKAKAGPKLVPAS